MAADHNDVPVVVYLASLAVAAGRGASQEEGLGQVRRLRLDVRRPHQRRPGLLGDDQLPRDVSLDDVPAHRRRERVRG